MRLLVELILFFVLPVVLSAFFYVKIAVRLVKRTKHAGRNHVLTLAFALSWLFWVICWSPNAFVLATKNYHYIDYDYEYSEFSHFDIIVSYAVIFRIPFQLLYSHLNPLLYLLVLKKFQKHHKQVFLGIFHLAFSTTRKRPIDDPYSRNVFLYWGVQISKIFKILVVSFSMVLMGLSMASSIYYGVGVINKVLDTQRVASETINRLNTQRAFFPLKFFTPIRSYCADHNGILNVDYRRCFILSTHLPRYLNFTAHLEYCEQEGTTMCYPRSHAEMRFMYKMLAQWAPDNMEPRLPWRHLYREETSITPDESVNQWYWNLTRNAPLANYHIHMGFVKKSESLFTSIDGQFNISSQTHSWSQTKYSSMRGYFFGPSVCLSSSLTTLWECTPSWSTPETFCCKDFFYKTALVTPVSSKVNS